LKEWILMERLVSNPSKTENTNLDSGMVISPKRSGAGCHISLAGMPLATSPGPGLANLPWKRMGELMEERREDGLTVEQRTARGIWLQIRVWSSFVRLGAWSRLDLWYKK
jgi:hypothetical protein